MRRRCGPRRMVVAQTAFTVPRPPPGPGQERPDAGRSPGSRVKARRTPSQAISPVAAPVAGGACVSLAAYSCRDSCGLGANPAPHSHSSPEGHRRDLCGSGLRRTCATGLARFARADDRICVRRNAGHVVPSYRNVCRTSYVDHITDRPPAGRGVARFPPRGNRASSADLHRPAERSPHAPSRPRRRSPVPPLRHGIARAGRNRAAALRDGSLGGGGHSRPPHPACDRPFGDGRLCDPLRRSARPMDGHRRKRGGTPFHRLGRRGPGDADIHRRGDAARRRYRPCPGRGRTRRQPADAQRRRPRL